MTWRSSPETARVEIQWLDADGNVIATDTVLVTKGRPFYTVPTPEGATEFGVAYYDAAGFNFAVGGGACL